MKEHTGVIIALALILSMALTTIAVNKHIKDNGGQVETIFNTPIKEIIKL